MEPNLYSGDLVIYRPFRPSKDTLKNGCIVVVRSPLERGNLIIKRIYKHNQTSIELRGDNETSSDDSRKFGLVSLEQVLGVVDQVIPMRTKSEFS